MNSLRSLCGKMDPDETGRRQMELQCEVSLHPAGRRVPAHPEHIWVIYAFFNATFISKLHSSFFFVPIQSVWKWNWIEWCRLWNCTEIRNSSDQKFDVNASFPSKSGRSLQPTRFNNNKEILPLWETLDFNIKYQPVKSSAVGQRIWLIWFFPENSDKIDKNYWSVKSNVVFFFYFLSQELCNIGSQTLDMIF